MSAPRGRQKPVRYWSYGQNRSIVITECDDQARANTCSIEYGQTIEQVRKNYANFRLLKANQPT